MQSVLQRLTLPLYRVVSWSVAGEKIESSSPQPSTIDRLWNRRMPLNVAARNWISVVDMLRASCSQHSARHIAFRQRKEALACFIVVCTAAEEWNFRTIWFDASGQSRCFFCCPFFFPPLHPPSFSFLFLVIFHFVAKIFGATLHDFYMQKRFLGAFGKSWK